jgi:hypothetical protein
MFNIAHSPATRRLCRALRCQEGVPAIATWDLAKRARRLAGTLTAAGDVERLLRYAEELDVQAVDLDRRAQCWQSRLPAEFMRRKGLFGAQKPWC